MALSHSEIAGLLPVLLLHPGEDSYPMAPAEFIRASRFRHHRAGAPDEGWSKAIGAWVLSDSRAPEFYDVPVSVISSFGRHPDGRNRRPRDPQAGRDLNVFLQPDGQPRGSRDFNGQAPSFYWVAGGSNLMVQVWFFYGYNDGPLSFNHQGDWEHVCIHVSVDGTPVSIDLSAHGRLSRVPIEQMRRIDGRPAVYVAKGTHAMYAAPGSYHLGIDQTAEGGPIWEPWRKLLPLETQPWRDFAGAWGEIGELPDTTGPLGPWHKLGA